MCKTRNQFSVFPQRRQRTMPRATLILPSICFSRKGFFLPGAVVRCHPWGGIPSMTVMWCLPSTFSMGLNTSGRSMFAPAHTMEGEQMPRPMDVPYLAGIATVGWLLSGLVAAWIPAALIIILGTGFVKPLDVHFVSPAPGERHARVSGHPVPIALVSWMPACAGMTQGRSN